VLFPNHQVDGIYGLQLSGIGTMHTPIIASILRRSLGRLEDPWPVLKGQVYYETAAVQKYFALHVMLFQYLSLLQLSSGFSSVRLCHF